MRGDLNSAMDSLAGDEVNFGKDREIEQRGEQEPTNRELEKGTATCH